MNAFGTLTGTYLVGRDKELPLSLSERLDGYVLAACRYVDLGHIHSPSMGWMQLLGEDDVLRGMEKQNHYLVTPTDFQVLNKIFASLDSKAHVEKMGYASQAEQIAAIDGQKHDFAAWAARLDQVAANNHTSTPGMIDDASLGQLWAMAGKRACAMSSWETRTIQAHQDAFDRIKPQMGASADFSLHAETQQDMLHPYIEVGSLKNMHRPNAAEWVPMAEGIKRRFGLPSFIDLRPAP